MKEITVQELKQRMDAGEDIQLIDVREAHEYRQYNIGGESIPMGQLMLNLDRLSKEKDIVVLCLSGNRSSAMVHALMSRGYENVINLKGGVIAWVNEIVKR